MRKKRVIQPNMCYHLVSRVAHRAFFFDDDEKDRFVDLLMRVEFFSGVRVLSYCCMSNHIHILIFLEEERELTEEEVLARVNRLYRGMRLKDALQEWMVCKGEETRIKETHGGSGSGSAFSQLLMEYKRRMFHPSEFMKTLKQDMTMSFNARRDHTGTIWESRFYDKMAKATVADMSAQAAYIDCNPAEAGICRNPADYRWCSWAAAMAGDEHARDMYRFIYEGVAENWNDIVGWHKRAIRARIGEIDAAVQSGGIVDRLFGIFGSGKGKKTEREKRAQNSLSWLAEKCEAPARRELQLEGGNSETAMRLLKYLADGEKSCAEIAEALGISSKPWLSKAYLVPLVAMGYVALTLPDRPTSRYQRYRLLQKGQTLL